MRTLAPLCAALAAIAALPGCGPAEPPAHSEVVVLSGSAYERGFQHGKLLGKKIRSLYTILLETNLMPYLNREQDDVMKFLEVYREEPYKNGQFSYRMMLESGENLLEILEDSHPEYAQEMHGIADGAGISFDRILVLNTFVDTMLAFRTVTLFLKQLSAPQLLEVEFLGDFADGVDNNGDGQTDEADDGAVKTDSRGEWLAGYSPRPHAVMAEVPAGARIRMRFIDNPGLGGFTGSPDEKPKEGDLQGMDPGSVRIQLGDVLYTAADDCIQSSLSGEHDEYLEVIFSPPGGLPEGEVVSLIVQSHDISEIADPLPVRPRVMRDERFVFTTRGAGLRPAEVPNKGAWDGRSMPPALGFAVRGSATPDGATRLAQHFALLDSNISHKHGVLFVHRPEDGEPFAVLGWAGLVWGFSGMNAAGLTCALNPSDTLDNPLVGQVKDRVMYALLLSTGIPAGIKGRILLERAAAVPEAMDLLAADGDTFGWNLLLGDRHGEIASVELDSNIMQHSDDGFHAFGPEDGIASEGPDDLRMASHFQANLPDLDDPILVFQAPPQKDWSSFYYRSLRAYYILGDEIRRHYGHMDLDGAIDILRHPDLVDTRESMNAVVFEPERGKLHYAMGQVPATDGDFVEFDLEASP
ncbi:MAG: hypothetical protein JXR96_20085 [Deltaproteobacteria bacterium]|nr:hypothetical protein [Deltaproteobacteria bacterium]